MKVRWLDRALIAGPYLALCVNDAQFRTALRHCSITDKVPFLKNEHAAATMHNLTNPEGERVCIVCLGSAEGKTGAQIAGLIVHESVHVWQEYRNDIGESEPSSEFEAYAIQTIAQRLMEEYVRQVH